MHPAESMIEHLLKDCEFQRTRRQGPGGQHRNKVETAVVVKHLPSGVIAEANEKRSQDANKNEAIFRLRLALAVEVRIDREPQPSELFRRRTVNGKLSVNPRHSDFPGVLAELIDRLQMNDYSIPETAKMTGISGSQILKFLKLHPPAFDSFNRERESRNLHRIKF